MTTTIDATINRARAWAGDAEAGATFHICAECLYDVIDWQITDALNEITDDCGNPLIPLSHIPDHDCENCGEPLAG